MSANTDTANLLPDLFVEVDYLWQFVDRAGTGAGMSDDGRGRTPEQADMVVFADTLEEFVGGGTADSAQQEQLRTDPVGREVGQVAAPALPSAGSPATEPRRHP